ncbi:MAG: polyprenyl synthetase family protein [Rikenellaceae bacterium]|nr:polyprenyl synthetase family protein [Rikenellaceae bacterium]
MHSREELSSRIEKYIAELSFPENPLHLYAPISYTLEEGGKRLRPLLTLIVCYLYGGDIQKALPCAGAIEVFHNFTLLHDDIMDNADIRRGKSAVHKKWDANTAILSGDAMVIYSYHLLQKSPAHLLPQLLADFNTMALEVCEGQQYDMDFESRDDVTLEEYESMIKLKTAVIFGAAAKMGGILAGAPEGDLKFLYDFGTELGLAFQIQDDYLDTYGTSELLGKQVGGDIEESKKTFLAITALNEAGAATRRALVSTFADRKLPLAHKIGRVKTIYDSLDIPRITRKVVAKHLDCASELLDHLSIEDPAPLRQVIRALEDRNK